MRTTTFLSLTIALAAALGAGCGGDDAETNGTTGGGNGECTEATAVDHTADAMTTITFPSQAYDPNCVKIAVGSSVKFSGNFVQHPLVGGNATSTSKMPDTSSPIARTATGTEATFTFPAAGTFGFYCDIHGQAGMTGKIFVQ
jgi:plastocyanin